MCLEGFDDKLVEVGFDGFEFELVSQDAEPPDMLVDSIHGIRDPSQGVLAKLWIIKMDAKVLQRQTET